MPSTTLSPVLSSSRVSLLKQASSHLWAGSECSCGTQASPPRLQHSAHQ